MTHLKLENLKKGDTFYKVEIDSITKYEYLMLYPFHNPVNVKVRGYHIILQKNIDEPKRIYYKDLENIISKNITTYEDAKKRQIEMVKEHLEYLQNKQN